MAMGPMGFALSPWGPIMGSPEVPGRSHGLCRSGHRGFRRTAEILRVARLQLVQAAPGDTEGWPRMAMGHGWQWGIA
jgi:hypothetical protein